MRIVMVIRMLNDNKNLIYLTIVVFNLSEMNLVLEFRNQILLFFDIQPRLDWLDRC